MKKTISILAACMLVFSFAGMASAQNAIPSAGECASAGTIDRGCETGGEQACTTSPFDYEDYGECASVLTELPPSYCGEADKGNYHRAFIPVCDCIENVEGFDEPEADDVYDVGMEILVDKHDGNGLQDGDNGVYFAEDINASGVPVQPMPTENCSDDYGCEPSEVFAGEYWYYLADGTTTSEDPVTGSAACDVPDDQEIVAFEPNPSNRPEVYDGSYGYQVTSDDVLNGRSIWWVDIPHLRADANETERGWTVYVKVTVQEAEETAGGGLCSDCPKCTHLVEIGSLCCGAAPGVCEDTLIYPYFPKTENFWYGMAITNVGDEEGTFSVTMYENDGTVAEIKDVAVDANSSIVWGHQTIFDNFTEAASSTEGNFGNSQSYFKVVTDFPASGFAMTASNDDGSNSMGYLPVRPSGCSNCDLCE